MRDRSSRPNRGLRRIRAVCLIAVAASAVSVVGVSSAQASPGPFSANVNYGWSTIGPNAAANPVSKLEILNGSQNATLSGTIESTTGAITAGSIAFPAQTFPGSSVGIPGAGATLGVDLVNAGPLTGQAGPVNPGQLSITGNYTLQVTIAGSSVGALNGECDYPVGDSANVVNPAVMSTETTTAVTGYPGRRFVPNTSTSPGSIAGNVATGAGVVVAGGGGAQCGALNPALQNKTGDLWFGRNSIPSTPVNYSQVVNFSRLNVGAATDLSIVGPVPAVYRGLISGTAPANPTDPTPTTANITVDPAALWSGSTNQGLDLTPNPGSFAGLSVSVDLEVQPTTTLAGDFNAATGVEHLGTGANDQYRATVVINGMLTCTSNNDPLDLSTEKKTTDPAPENFAPRDGVRFTNGLGGNGALMDGWNNLNPFTPSPACDQLSGLTAGLPGGLWFSHGIDPAATAPPGGGGSNNTPGPTATPPAAKKKCKKSKGKKGSASAAKSKCKKKK